MQLATVIDPVNSFDKLKMYVYDTEYDEALTVDASFKIFKDIKGLSQLNINNSLYLCGTPNNYENAGSYLIRYDIGNISSNSNFLVNSIFPHYKPTMIGIKNEYILVIGGEKMKRCEYFNLKTNKWRSVPELPEERFNCCAVYEENSENVYLFGGFNSLTGHNCSSILFLNFRVNLTWETQLIKDNTSLLARNSSAIIKFDRTSIYILGGIDNDNNCMDSIVEFDLQSKELGLSRKKLIRAASFSLQTGVDLNKAEYSFFDNDNFVHRIAKSEFKINLIDFKEIMHTNDDQE